MEYSLFSEIVTNECGSVSLESLSKRIRKVVLSNGEVYHFNPRDKANKIIGLDDKFIKATELANNGQIRNVYIMIEDITTMHFITDEKYIDNQIMETEDGFQQWKQLKKYANENGIKIEEDEHGNKTGNISLDRNTSDAINSALQYMTGEGL